jgi:hypothetical protein
VTEPAASPEQVAEALVREHGTRACDLFPACGTDAVWRPLCEACQQAQAAIAQAITEARTQERATFRAALRELCVDDPVVLALALDKVSHDSECESELTSHGYTPCRCAEREDTP